MNAPVIKAIEAPDQCITLNRPPAIEKTMPINKTAISDLDFIISNQSICEAEVHCEA